MSIFFSTQATFSYLLSRKFLRFFTEVPVISDFLLDHYTLKMVLLFVFSIHLILFVVCF